MICSHNMIIQNLYDAICLDCGQKAKLGKFKLRPAFGHVRVKGAMEYLKKMARLSRGKHSGV